MKTATKTKAAKVAVSVVREPVAIDQMFKRNSLGYLETNCNEANLIVSTEDAVGYVVSKLDAGQSAIRDAILFSAWVFKNKPEEQSKAYAEQLKARWSGSTIPNLISISKALPSFEDKGLSIDKVKDLYALREVSKLLKGEDTSKQAVALLNEGKSPRAVKDAIQPKEKPVKQVETTSAPSPVNIGEEADKLETLILTYVDRYAKLGEHEARLKLTRQIIAKMVIGNYTFLPSDAAAAVQTLKAKK
jgi:hypothetical protein